VSKSGGKYKIDEELDMSSCLVQVNRCVFQRLLGTDVEKLADEATGDEHE
jgi:hypothetical protein